MNSCTMLQLSCLPTMVDYIFNLSQKKLFYSRLDRFLSQQAAANKSPFQSSIFYPGAIHFACFEIVLQFTLLVCKLCYLTSYFFLNAAILLLLKVLFDTSSSLYYDLQSYVAHCICFTIASITHYCKFSG